MLLIIISIRYQGYGWILVQIFPTTPCYLYKCVWSRFKSSNRMLSFMCGCMILCVQSSWLYMKSIRLFLFFWSLFLFRFLPCFTFVSFQFCVQKDIFLFEPKRYSSQISMKCFNSLEKKNMNLKWSFKITTANEYGFHLNVINV